MLMFLRAEKIVYVMENEVLQETIVIIIKSLDKYQKMKDIILEKLAEMSSFTIDQSQESIAKILEIFDIILSTFKTVFDIPTYITDLFVTTHKIFKELNNFQNDILILIRNIIFRILYKCLHYWPYIILVYNQLSRIYKQNTPKQIYIIPVILFIAMHSNSDNIQETIDMIIHNITQNSKNTENIDIEHLILTYSNTQVVKLYNDIMKNRDQKFKKYVTTKILDSIPKTDQTIIVFKYIIYNEYYSVFTGIQKLIMQLDIKLQYKKIIYNMLLKIYTIKTYHKYNNETKISFVNYLANKLKSNYIMDQKENKTNYTIDTTDCNDDPFQIIEKININILGMNRDENNIESRILQVIHQYTKKNNNRTNLEIYNKFIKYALLFIFCASNDEAPFRKITPDIFKINQALIPEGKVNKTPPLIPIVIITALTPMSLMIYKTKDAQIILNEDSPHNIIPISNQILSSDVIPKS